MSLYLITDRQSAGNRSLERVVEDALDGGITALQVRCKDAAASELVDLCRILLPMTRNKGIPLIVNDRVDVAIAVDADGVHLGGDDLPVSRARELLGENKIVGATAATPRMAEQAARCGADYLGIGPFKPTETKKRHARPLGLQGLLEVASATDLPWVAVGGITSEDVEGIIRAGAHGVAVASAICGAPSPREAAASFMRAVYRGREEA